ncbi:MAG TPA: tripartite tricarboxylate transporter substrate binding protein [Eoetvoesiella sp.]
MNKLTTVALQALAALSITAMLPMSVSAQTQTIRMVVPFSPGGPADLIARKIGARLSSQLDATVVVDNRPGANGKIGVNAVSNAAGDGSVLLFATSGMLTISPGLYKDLGYDPLKDLTPISRAVANGTALLVNSKIPASNVKELVEYANKSTGPVPMGSAGVGNITHLYLELLQDSSKMNLMHIPYKGVAPALTDVMGGQIAGVFVDLPAALPLIQGGKVKALGVVGSQRSPSAPNIPTIEEQGYTGVDGVSWFGIMGPATMQPEAAQRIHAGLAAVMKEPEMIKELRDIGSVPAVNTPAEMRKLIEDDQARWNAVIKAKDIKVD